MRRLLLVASAYPPAPGVGGIRVAGLTRHLRAHGWDTTVLTPALGTAEARPPHVLSVDAPDVVAALRARLHVAPGQPLSDAVGGDHPGLREHVARHVVRLAKGALTYPDTQPSWIRPAVSAALTLRPDAVLSTSPGVSAHLIGHRLTRKLEVPWVADLRDLWSDNPYTDHGPLRRAADRRLERRTLAPAAALTTVSEELAEALRARHACPVLVVPNGFDPELVHEPAQEAHRPGSLVIAYTGLLHVGRRDPSVLLDAMARLRRDGFLHDADLRLEVSGPPMPWLRRAAVDRGVDDLVVHRGQADQAEAVRRQRAADVLLLVTWDHEADRGTCPAKLFEYMAAGKPVLAVGSVASRGQRIVEETGLGASFSSTDVSGVTEHLRALVTEHRATGGVKRRARPDALEAHSQTRMAAQMAALLDRVAGSGQQPSTW